MQEFRYQIEYSEESLDFLKSSPSGIRIKIIRAIEQRLSTDPNHYGKPMAREYVGYRRLRAGDWRVIYKVIENKLIVLVIDIDHRKDIYD